MILLDSHIWYWWITQDGKRLPASMLETIESADRVGVSAVSCFELALAHRKGRLEFPVPPKEWFPLALKGSDIECFPVDEQIALKAVDLTEVHRDPFDRIIIATALSLKARLASVDGHFSSYPELSDVLL